MKVLIVGLTKIAYMPYLNFYLSALRISMSEVSLLYWDRDGLPDAYLPSDVVTYRYYDTMSDEIPLFNKIPRFLKYRNFAIKIINGSTFDLLIILHSTTGVLLSDILFRKYSEKYILDYRDATYENSNLYKKIIQKLVDKSVITFVSSRGFLKFLPLSSKLIISHNLIMYTDNERSVRKYLQRESKCIKIRFWGFIRHPVINKQIIERLSNDPRFELHFHGREQKSAKFLKEFVVGNNIGNVYFHGEYQPNERLLYASRTDIIHNIYENDRNTINAMGNKFYDGLSFYIPQLCNEGSFMGEELKRAGVGLSIDPIDIRFADLIYEYYNSINWSLFELNCDKKLAEIINEYKTGEETFCRVIENE